MTYIQAYRCRHFWSRKTPSSPWLWWVKKHLTFLSWKLLKSLVTLIPYFWI